jgi:hypothetical protein
VTLKVTWPQALAWRLDRHMLARLENASTEDVVRRLCGVQAQVASSAELAVRLRQKTSQPGDVAAALADGRLIKTWAMRGTLHLLTPQEGGAFLSLMAAGRSWERPSWQRYFGMSASHWDQLREAVREALDGTALTREEVAAAITRRPELGHLADELRSGWGTLFKPLAWWGELAFGASRDGRPTFVRPEDASSLWAGVPDPDEAAPLVISSYLGTYGPSTIDGVRRWLARGRIGMKSLRTWFAALGDRLAEVEVDGDRAYLLADDVDELAATQPTTAVRLLPGFDQYVLGPGTEDAHVIPAGRRTAVSRQSGWISPVVVARGTVSGTWVLDGEVAQIAWFEEAGRLPRTALEAEVERLSSILGRQLRATISRARRPRDGAWRRPPPGPGRRIRR